MVRSTFSIGAAAAVASCARAKLKLPSARIVQEGVFEGIWVPLEQAKDLAMKYDIFSDLKSLLEHENTWMEQPRKYIRKPSMKRIDSKLTDVNGKSNGHRIKLSEDDMNTKPDGAPKSVRKSERTITYNTPPYLANSYSVVSNGEQVLSDAKSALTKEPEVDRTRGVIPDFDEDGVEKATKVLKRTLDDANYVDEDGMATGGLEPTAKRQKVSASWSGWAAAAVLGTGVLAAATAAVTGNLSSLLG